LGRRIGNQGCRQESGRILRSQISPPRCFTARLARCGAILRRDAQVFGRACLRAPGRKEVQTKKRRRARWPGGVGMRRLAGGSAVGALSVGALEGFNRSPSLFHDRAAQKVAHGVGLPAGHLHQFLQSDAARPFQQIDHLGRFAAAAGGSYLFSGALGGWLRLNQSLAGCGCVLASFSWGRCGHWIGLSFARQLPRHDIDHSARLH